MGIQKGRIGVGLKLSRLILTVSSFLLLAGSVHAMPQLRLSNASIGPVSIAVGSVGAQQRLEAWNAGDGSLALTATPEASWLTATIGGAGPCMTRGGTCFPIRINLGTAALAKGMHTGVVRITDPNAADAPQSITVTVQMGGGVPDEVSLFVPPNGAADTVEFSTNSPLQYTVSTTSGGNWLSLAAEGAGSFDFSIPYRIQGRHMAGMGEGTYNGSINVTGSSFAPDIKRVPVTMQVTSQPIVRLAPDEMDVRIAQDSLTLDKFIVVSNRGMGSLSVDSVTATAADGGAWLAATWLPQFQVIQVSINSAGLVPGKLSGTVRVETNAVNGTMDVPVNVTVGIQTGPTVSYQGVVNNATFEAGEEVPQGGIVALFGEQLSYQGPSEGTEIPLVRDLGGARVFVNGQDTPLFFTSYNQINFQIPYDAAGGVALVQVTRDGQPGNVISVRITDRNPRILTFLGNYGIAVRPDGSFPIPTSPARQGETIVIYAIGFGQTSPNAGTGEGATADPLQWIRPLPVVYFGGGLLPIPAVPGFVGLTPGFVGLYQINVTIPGNSPRGDRVPLLIEGTGYVTNQVDIAIQ
jgi:uncharacterized protein (TIGR03437 family)